MFEIPFPRAILSAMKWLKFLPVPVCLLALLVLPARTQLASPSLDLARQLNQAFVEVAERVSPAVVVITVKEKPDRTISDSENPDENSPRENRRRNRRRFQDPEEYSVGQGSGVIVREDGYIVTNGHVVDNAESIEVRLKDGRTFKATVRGVDPRSDVAVLKIDARRLPIAKFADTAKTRVGEFAIAVGAPFGLDYSVTFGHVSAKGRTDVVPDYAGGTILDQDFIQTDANINPGNSGGPLVNIDGEVIGINTLIRGLRTGIGFAIPGTLVREVSEQLIADGKFTRAWLGVTIRALRDDLNARARIKGVVDGVIVNDIVPGGPASKSELHTNDVIIAVEGHRVTTPQELRNEIRPRKLGVPITLEVARDGRNLKVNIKPAEWVDETATLARNDAPARAFSPALELGLSVRSLTANQRAAGGEGVFVTAVTTNSIAAKHGLKAGDIITSVNHQPVSNRRDFMDALREASLERGILFNYIRDKKESFKVLKTSP
ncbi:MAG: PDZ domain-containing protein, partial [Verrucomicrobia bacterium]